MWTLTMTTTPNLTMCDGFATLTTWSIIVNMTTMLL